MMCTPKEKELKYIDTSGNYITVVGIRVSKPPQSTCYICGDHVLSVTPNAVMCKHVLSLLPRIKHLPVVTLVGTTDGCRVYSAPFYSPCTDVVMMLTINSIFGWHTVSQVDLDKDLGLSDDLMKAFRAIKATCLKVRPDFNWDFPERNFGMDANGDVVLMDPVFH